VDQPHLWHFELRIAHLIVQRATESTHSATAVKVYQEAAAASLSSGEVLS